MKQSSHSREHSNAQPTPPDLQPAEDEWRHHEHVSEQVQADADQLLKSAGGSDVAKHAVDVATARQEERESAKHEFAAKLGFDSYEAACEGSQQFGRIEGPNWYVTARSSQTYVAWNDRDLQVEFTCGSRPEALERLEQRRSEAAAAEDQK